MVFSQAPWCAGLGVPSACWFCSPRSLLGGGQPHVPRCQPLLTVLRPPPAHMDSEAEGRSCASAGGHPSSMARGPASPPPSPETPSPTPLSPDLPSLDPARCDLLGSRLERE